MVLKWADIFAGANQIRISSRSMPPPNNGSARISSDSINQSSCRQTMRPDRFSLWPPGGLHLLARNWPPGSKRQVSSGLSITHHSSSSSSSPSPSCSTPSFSSFLFFLLILLFLIIPIPWPLVRGTYTNVDAFAATTHGFCPPRNKLTALPCRSEQ